jgi:hypothetical protein
MAGVFCEYIPVFATNTVVLGGTRGVRGTNQSVLGKATVRKLRV